MLCLAGTGRVELGQGCAVLINSNVLHRFESMEDAFIPNFVFSPALLAPEESLIYQKYIRPVVDSEVPFQVFCPDVPWQNQILKLLPQIFALQEAGQANELRTLALLLALWEPLFEHSDFTSCLTSSRRLHHSQARLQTMMQYIHDHYREELTLDQIAASASVSKSGALHMFQSGIHTSPVAYLIQYRLSQAAGLLGTTQDPVSSIAEETGFASAGYFCRKFRQHYHMTPNEYRQKKKR